MLPTGLYHLPLGEGRNLMGRGFAEARQVDFSLRRRNPTSLEGNGTISKNLRYTNPKRKEARNALPRLQFSGW